MYAPVSFVVHMLSLFIWLCTASRDDFSIVPLKIIIFLTCCIWETRTYSMEQTVQVDPYGTSKLCVGGGGEVGMCVRPGSLSKGAFKWWLLKIDLVSSNKI